LEPPSFLADLASRRSLFEARGRFLAVLRNHFRRRGFLEVDPPLLVPAAGMEPHLDPFETRGPCTGNTAFLPTSPEFYLKELLASGVERCFALTPAFRDERPSRRHSPEFLMLEWYRARAKPRAIVRDCETLLRRVGRLFLPGGVLRGREAPCDLTAGAEALSLSMAFRQWAGYDWLDLIGLSDWREAARAAGAGVTETWSENDCFSYLMLAVVEPALALVKKPVVLEGFPAFQAALARLDPRDARVAQRFELYVAGVELANGYAELTDGQEQRARYAAYQAQREAMGKRPHPPDERFFEAVERLPPCAGIALGADRLLALLLGESVARVRHGITNGE
jgi:lysyl-tRNA synthetase class 2